MKAKKSTFKSKKLRVFLLAILAMAVAVAFTFTLSGCDFIDNILGKDKPPTVVVPPEEKPNDPPVDPPVDNPPVDNPVDPPVDNPDTPDNPPVDNPDNPDTPDNPPVDNPDNPDNPDTPDNPPVDNPDNPDNPPEEGDTEGKAEEVPEAQFSIHFLELGNKYTGDSTLIKCGDIEILIDAGSRKDSAATIKKYIDQYCTDGVLEYVIVTHAHQDHIAGFVGNSSGGKKTGILYQYEVGTLIQFARTNATSQIYKDYCTAVNYVQSNGTIVYNALQCWNETDGAQKQYFLNNEKTLSMNILYNYYYDHNTSDENDYSVCMLLTNEYGGTTYNYLFTGDLEENGEKYLVQYNQLPEVELFKGGHHGSYTASTDALLKVIKPKNVAVCCCCGTTEYTSNKANTFPSQAFINRVSKYTQNIYCTTLIVDYSGGKFTSMNGNIVFYFTDKLKLYCTNNTTILKDTDWFKENRTWPDN